MKRNQIDTDLGAAIKEGIILNNMTQKADTKALHISQQTLSCYIHNQRTPNIHDLVAISQILNLDIYVLLGLKEGHTGSSGSYYIQKYNEAGSQRQKDGIRLRGAFVEIQLSALKKSAGFCTGARLPPACFRRYRLPDMP